MLSSEICKVSKNAFYYRRVPVAASEVQLLFLREFETKDGATVSNKYQLQLGKSICCRENPEAATVGVL